MKIPLIVSLASCLWRCIHSFTTTTDGIVQDENCATGYNTYDSDTGLVREVKYYIYCTDSQHCCDIFEYRYCCPYQYYSPYDYPSNNAIIFGGIAGAIMFLCFAVCVIARWTRKPVPAIDPQTAQVLRSITGGNIPRTPFTGLILSTGDGSAIHMSTLSTQTFGTSGTETQSVNASSNGSHTVDTNAAPPPLYEDCVRNSPDLTLQGSSVHPVPSPQVDNVDTSMTIHMDTRSDHDITSDSEHSNNVNVSDSITCL
ncbi:uncharacterized protein LOC132550738 [Ylistrum balloti]|uniref:uncharacterized protein LOC132550738 n=1 Tax=Ylistrum balloti TaxID=509963 RepID=UPI002905C427|nr:uncharacterized protein LOC132550738 [Ylistrum balloti]